MLRTIVTGETMIFKNDKGFYSTSFSKKNQDGEYVNAYINVAFKKGVNLENKTRINITNGFLTFDDYTNKDGKIITSYKIFVLDFEQVGSKAQAKPVEDNTVFGAISDDDLPF